MPLIRRVSGYTDIRAGGWVARLPEGWRPYALLMRLDRPIGSWLLFLPGLWAFAMAAPSWGRGLWLTILFGLGAVLMRGAGCVVNDLWDRDLDRQVERTAGRPLASGAVQPKQALAFLLGLLLVSLLILVQLPWSAILLGVLSLVPIALYPLAKRVTDWPQAVLGVVFSWAAPMGYASATGGLDAAAIALWAAGFFWILGYDTIYAHQDREDDALVGIRSTALRFGEKTRPFLAACYAVTLVLLLLAGWLAGLSWLYVPALLLPAALLARQVLTIDIGDPALCLRLFKANRDVGLAIALAFLIGRL
ncbi:4-hydroxybenzoate octaprenyltransferase [Neoroseomonas oryzicola]|uniref:4-hydroxybenzoate octaprenyltransferase n=1 Tax=Neoroseomonas oryzicola TaxID=535904 RepID=A0A9X9WIN0_9PROT|nr:4-hydroxybenzoate octaprenyltransferase [Neoroseomonas oryzicola]MBR0660190.1 4-hydroxybenzoate octaprenyltransferase [Neoroseomonas oryzicola]NKE20134.1 4-hydroxybenzoate octaprenyltransferase [Neoroseomonas oryzicola]